MDFPLFLFAAIIPKDALVNLIRRARPVFLQCVQAKTEAGSFDVPGLRAQLQSTQILSALQFHRTGQDKTPPRGRGGSEQQQGRDAAEITQELVIHQDAVQQDLYQVEAKGVSFANFHYLYLFTVEKACF